MDLQDVPLNKCNQTLSSRCYSPRRKMRSWWLPIFAATRSLSLCNTKHTKFKHRTRSIPQSYAHLINDSRFITTEAYVHYLWRIHFCGNTEPKLLPHNIQNYFYQITLYKCFIISLLIVSSGVIYFRALERSYSSTLQVIRLIFVINISWSSWWSSKNILFLIWNKVMISYSQDTDIYLTLK